MAKAKVESKPANQSQQPPRGIETSRRSFFGGFQETTLANPKTSMEEYHHGREGLPPTEGGFWGFFRTPKPPRK